MARHSMTAAILALALTLLAGCGGGGSSATHSTAARSTHIRISAMPTHAVFIRRLDAVCAAENSKAAGHQKAIAQAINANDLKKAGDILSSTQPQASAFFVRVERVIPSAEDRAAFVHYLALTHQLFRLDERLVAVLHASHVGEVTRLGGLARKVHSERTTTAVALRSRKCGT
jgi:hypothetical protein